MSHFTVLVIGGKVQTMLRELPPDTRLTLLDCHI